MLNILKLKSRRAYSSKLNPSAIIYFFISLHNTINVHYTYTLLTQIRTIYILTSFYAESFGRVKKTLKPILIL